MGLFGGFDSEVRVMKQLLVKLTQNLTELG